MLLTVGLVGVVVFLIWLAVLTFLFWQVSSHYNNLTKGVSTKTLKFILESIIRELQVLKKDVDYTKAACDRIDKQGALHIQKIGLMRFNPFKDTGGDQSFILSLLDGENTGVVISGLYSRSGTRWYAKKVVKGLGVGHELSDDEKKALKEAKSTSELAK